MATVMQNNSNHFHHHPVQQIIPNLATSSTSQSKPPSATAAPTSDHHATDHQQQQQQQPATQPTPPQTSTPSQSSTARRADAFASLVSLIWFSSGTSLAGASTPLTKSPTSTFQPLHSSPLAPARQSANGHAQRRSLAEIPSAANPLFRPQSQSATHPGQYEEPDAFANSVRRALEDHLKSSNGSGVVGGQVAASTSPELNSLDGDLSTQRLIPHVSTSGVR